MQYRKKIRELRNGYIDNLTIHGATKILTGTIPERIFWTLITAFVMVYFFYSAKLLVIKFMEYESITNNEVVKFEKLPLPSVTVCDVISFVCSSIQYKNSSVNCNAKRNRTLHKMVDRFERSVECRKNGAYTNKSCAQEPTLHHPGCITINPKLTLTQNSPGRSRLIRYRVKPNSQGVYLFFHNPDEVPSFVHRFHHKIIANGIHDVIVTRTDFKRLTAPYRSNCSTPTFNSSMFPYSGSLCHQKCVARNMFDTFGTVGDNWWKYLPRSIYENHTYPNNKNITDEEMRKQIKAYLYDYHSPCNCIVPCKETLYEATIKQTSAFYKDMIALTLYFDKLEITRSSEMEAYDSTRFMADIGGLVGLLIGMSMLSVVEVCVCFALYLVDLMLVLMLKIC